MTGSSYGTFFIYDCTYNTIVWVELHLSAILVITFWQTVFTQYLVNAQNLSCVISCKYEKVGEVLLMSKIY